VTQGHVNNVNYYRYAESARVNWISNFAVHVDPKHRDEWRDLMSPKATGLIMRSLKADFKFVGACPPATPPSGTIPADRGQPPTADGLSRQDLRLPQAANQAAR
jgi:hypothetical protein